MAAVQKDLETSLTKLALDPKYSGRSSPSKPKRAAVADSWEDEDEESASDDNTITPLAPQDSRDYPSAPPPTPASPRSPLNFSSTERFITPFGDISNASPSGTSPRTRHNQNGDMRPEKTNAVANRLIAGALGVKAPKRTEEQRQYDRAMKEKEIKRRNAEKEAEKTKEEDAAKARAAAWDD